MADVLTFGELMLRLTTPVALRFAQTDHFQVTFGGAEANVAVALAQLGGSAGFLSRMPANDLADRALAELRSLGVDTAPVVRGGDRLGVYFLEPGASQRAGKVIYDRAHSAMAEAGPEDFAWDRLFAGVQWFHWSGITAALSAGAAEAVRQGCEAARRLGLTVSCDLNYRAKLWSYEQAGKTLAPLLSMVDLCVTSAEEARHVFAAEQPPAGEDAAVAGWLHQRFGCSSVALTQRRAAAADATEWGALLWHQGEAHASRRHHISIVDRLGAGDSFTGALIFSLRRGESPAAAVEFAVAASALKHTIFGDYNRVTLEEVEALAAGGGGGRVRR